MLKVLKHPGLWVIPLIVLFLNAYSIVCMVGANNSRLTAGIVPKQRAAGHNLVMDEPVAEISEAAQTRKKVEGVRYVVKQGDTLWDIASTYKIGVESITSANNLSSPDSLQIGQEVVIPGATELKEVKTSTAKTASTTTKAAAKTVASRSSTSILGGMWPVKGRVSSGFGMRDGKLHKGIDIAAPTGANVYAFAGGKIVFSGWNSGGYGYLIIINNGNGIETYYAHNSKLLVSAGQTVSKGQHIAEVGSTGDADGPHCHFEIRKNGAPVNPLSYLK